MLLLLLALALALASPYDEAVANPDSTRGAWLSWQSRLSAPPERSGPDARLEGAYRFYGDIQAELLPLVVERPGVITPFELGRTVERRPIWAFRVVDPAGPPATRRLLVLAQIHPIEWLPAEVATSFLLELARSPVPGVEVVVVPIFNLDGRLVVERDLQEGHLDRYRRGNHNGVDLNRDWSTNRDSTAIWRHLIPNRYTVSPAPLSQPETQAMDRLAAEGFDVSVSLHAFGGYVYYPWAGRWDRIPKADRAEHERLGQVMAAGMPTNPYHVKQLSHWAFFFRGVGMEVDHMYARYGSTSFLVELGRSGFRPLRPREWKLDFRMFNPADPRRATAQGVGALRALVHSLGEDAAASRLWGRGTSG